MSLLFCSFVENLEIISLFSGRHLENIGRGDVEGREFAKSISNFVIYVLFDWIWNII